ncbi:hypothetical protein GDO78_004016 [Eleutherodactylus coqui]|uniref:NADH dehydrogenase [ubiquinone] 1 alpha subcomplex assembly factor 8 n=1 Tax=Eleutherodactylus coqui TaxID=57060 RepID=A0A8J6ER24_ELECQ|nr:hypothetical protein GDO78_004016 [Eleutherodactylus coqui]
MSARTGIPGRWTTRSIPRLLVECRLQAAAYGRCVSADATELRKGACAREFEAFKLCITEAARRSTR